MCTFHFGLFLTQYKQINLVEEVVIIFLEIIIIMSAIQMIMNLMVVQIPLKEMSVEYVQAVALMRGHAIVMEIL